jgi:hypothetical protein
MRIQLDLFQRLSVNIDRAAPEEERRQIGLFLCSAIMQPRFIMQSIDQSKRIVSVEHITVKLMFPDNGLFFFIDVVVRSEAKVVVGAARKPCGNFGCFDNDFSIAGCFVAYHAFRAFTPEASAHALTVLTGVNQNTGPRSRDCRGTVDRLEGSFFGSVAGLVISANCADMKLTIVPLLRFPEIKAVTIRQNRSGIIALFHHFSFLSLFFLKTFSDRFHIKDLIGDISDIKSVIEIPHTLRSPTIESPPSTQIF